MMSRFVHEDSFFFFKQKTAYEIKECDWSPDVCSSDLVTYPDLAAAKAARATLDAGKTFADLARERRMNPSDIQIGTLSKDDLGERGAAVFSVPPGGVTQPLKAPVGYALIHVVSLTPGKSRSLDEVKEELRKQIATQLAGAKIADIGNQYIDENSRGEPLAKAAAKAGMQVGHIDAIDAKGNM